MDDDCEKRFSLQREKRLLGLFRQGLRRLTQSRISAAVEGVCLPLDDGDVISAGDGHLTVHHAPGHTEGSICLPGLFADIDILFAGDAIGGAMRTLDGASLEIWAQAAPTWQPSLPRLMALDFDWVLNGYEPASSLPMHCSGIDQMAPMFGKMLNP